MLRFARARALARGRWLALAVSLCAPCVISQAALAQDLFAPGNAPPPQPARGEPFAEAEAPGEVLTRGPVHEAFAEPVTFNPEPGLIVTRPPPAAVEELPPEQKPSGENVAWISGYWTWDDDRKDFIWVSGIYRVLPPGRQWMPGYWNKVGAGHQWVSGFWSSAREGGVEYYPTPPNSLEVGPSSDAPSAEHLWVPGYWDWRETRYAWRTGYWTPAHEGWLWVPAHYAWTPHGCVFVAGYWDMPLERRGLLFAPVYFDPLVAARPRCWYRPSVVISVDILTSHLFCRPAHRHYCFGDYYAASYADIGIFPWFAFHLSRHGYCPVYAHHHWHHRHDAGWSVGLRRDYDYRRNHIDARPPRTLVAQQTVVNNIQNNLVVNRNVNTRQMTLARSLSDAGARDTSLRLERVDRQQQEQIREQTRDARRFQEERGRLESAANSGGTPRARAGGPSRLELRSPIASRATSPEGSRASGGEGRATPRSRFEGDPSRNEDRARSGRNDDGNSRGREGNGPARSGRTLPGGAPPAAATSPAPSNQGAVNPSLAPRRNDAAPRNDTPRIDAAPRNNGAAPGRNDAPRGNDNTPRRDDAPRNNETAPRRNDESPRDTPRRSSETGSPFRGNPPAPQRTEPQPAPRIQAPPPRVERPPQRIESQPTPRNNPQPSRGGDAPRPQVRSQPAPRASSPPPSQPRRAESAAPRASSGGGAYGRGGSPRAQEPSRPQGGGGQRGSSDKGRRGNR